MTSEVAGSGRPLWFGKPAARWDSILSINAVTRDQLSEKSKSVPALGTFEVRLMQPMLIRYPAAQCINMPDRLPVFSTPIQGHGLTAMLPGAGSPTVIYL